jgi:hypothetical protein
MAWVRAWTRRIPHVDITVIIHTGVAVSLLLMVTIAGMLVDLHLIIIDVIRDLGFFSLNAMHFIRDSICHFCFLSRTVVVMLERVGCFSLFPSHLSFCSGSLSVRMYHFGLFPLVIFASRMLSLKLLLPASPRVPVFDIL